MMQYEHERGPVRRQEGAAYPAPAPDQYSLMKQYLRGRGLSFSLARRNGWYPSVRAGDAVPRMVIPASNSAGVAYWQARAIAAADKRYQSPPVGRGDSIILAWPFDGLARINQTPVVVVVEGPLDALAAAEAGMIGAGLMGNQAQGPCFDYLHTLFPHTPFLVIPDKDSPDAGAAWQAELCARGALARLLLIDDKDLAEIPRVTRKDMLWSLCADRP